MIQKILWEFPVPSTALTDDVRLFYPGATARMTFSYYDMDNDTSYTSGIDFIHVQALRHTTEKFVVSFGEAYDHLVEVIQSDWVNQLREIDPRIADLWDIKHFAIYLDSSGFYEFIASDFKVMEPQLG